MEKIIVIDHFEHKVYLENISSTIKDIEKYLSSKYDFQGHWTWEYVNDFFYNDIKII